MPYGFSSVYVFISFMDTGTASLETSNLRNNNMNKVQTISPFWQMPGGRNVLQNKEEQVTVLTLIQNKVCYNV
ncbi:hypothetical protein TCA2_1922 [Paenibacillus sp. TCA20]|nr:hypothetical protein TCA2_1922 [Paenibacillus sp. TCA20]